MDSLNIPELSIGIINDGEIAYHQTFGYAESPTIKLVFTTKRIKAKYLYLAKNEIAYHLPSVSYTEQYATL